MTVEDLVIGISETKHAITAILRRRTLAPSLQIVRDGRDGRDKCSEPLDLLVEDVHSFIWSLGESIKKGDVVDHTSHYLKLKIGDEFVTISVLMSEEDTECQ